LGLILIGTIVAAVLLGVTYTQTFYYYTSKPSTLHYESTSHNVDTGRLPSRFLVSKAVGAL